MNKADFARLIAVSHQMVSKYAADGRLVLRDDGTVDAHASLTLLDGHLDGEKHAAAVAMLEAHGETLPQAAASPPSAAPARGAKAELDEIKRDQALMQLARDAGELVPVTDVVGECHAAVQALKEAFDLAIRETTDHMMRDLDLPLERQAAVQRHLRRFAERGMTAFADAMDARVAEFDAGVAESVAA